MKPSTLARLAVTCPFAPTNVAPSRPARVRTRPSFSRSRAHHLPPRGFPHLRLALRAFAVVEVIQALVDSVAGLVKKHFDEARVFEHYGMICLALDEIVSDGVAEATSWDAIRRGIKLKMSS